MHARVRSAATTESAPRLGDGVDPARLSLTPEEGYLLSRIDGRTPLPLLREIGGLAPDEVERCVERWIEAGILVLGDAGTPADPEPPRAPAACIDEDAVDPSLEIPVEVQRAVLAFEGRLGRPYHEILGVPADTDAKTLKRTYFRLSKEFHPDRYFRRKLGPFAERLDRVFKAIVEAYELLSDPMARVEIARSMEAAQRAAGILPRPATETAGSGAGAAPRRLLRGRHAAVFSSRSRAMRERRTKAKRFFEAGMTSFTSGRWLEAAGSVRLAIAYDPWNEAYRERFAEVQRRAHEERAAQLVREAEAALELRDYPAALRAFEEATHFRPHDPELLHRAARLSWIAGGDLRQAKEWALAAVEIEPRKGAYRRLLGQIYKAAGLEANARRELEAALSLNPLDEEAQKELRSLGGRLQAPRWLGGRR
jgi:curved DNA-binding protein CbpA